VESQKDLREMPYLSFWVLLGLLGVFVSQLRRRTAGSRCSATPPGKASTSKCWMRLRAGPRNNEVRRPLTIWLPRTASPGPSAW